MRHGLKLACFLKTELLMTLSYGMCAHKPQLARRNVLSEDKCLSILSFPTKMMARLDLQIQRQPLMCTLVLWPKKKERRYMHSSIVTPFRTCLNCLRHSILLPHSMFDKFFASHKRAQIVLAIFCCALYANTLLAGFTFDDNFAVVRLINLSL